MSLVHVPFLRGADQSADPKVAPLGVLKNAENVRFSRDGRVVKRPGYDVHSVATDSNGITPTLSSVVALLARDSDRVALLGDYGPCVYNKANGKWTKIQNASLVPGTDFAAGERFPVGRNRSGQTLRSAIGYANGVICTAFESSGKIYVSVFTEADFTLIFTKEITGGSSACIRPKIVAVGSKFLVFYLNKTASPYTLSFVSIDTTTSPPTVGARVDVDTNVDTSHDYYDASTFSGTECLVVYQLTSTVQTVYRMAANGSITTGTSIAAAGPMATCGAAGERISVAWRESSGSIKLMTLDQSLATFAGPTLIDSSSSNQGAPVVARDSSTTVLVAWSADSAAASDQATTFTTRNSTTNAAVLGPIAVGRYRLASKVAYFAGRPYVWKVNNSTYDRYYVLSQAYASPISTVLARSLAVDFPTVDHFSEFVSYTDAQGRTIGLWIFPWISSGSVKSSTPFCSIDAVKIEFGGTEQSQSAVVNKTLYYSRGMLSMFDGVLAHEVGFIDSPEILTATGQAGGSMAVSTYQYVMTREWYDAAGQKHISQVSDPKSVTLTAGQSAVAVKYRLPGGSQRDTGAREYFVRDHIWRTAGNGTIFQRITTDSGLPNVVNSLGSATFTDTAADATIAVNAVLYTQGIRGALSGPLQHDPPAPCRYLWAGKERMIIGGLENSNEVRWSKFFFPGEPIEFSENTNFRKRIPGRVTAVAMLDDASIAFTKDRIFLVYGDGPDDSGNGTFQEPRALPSDVGCINWRSLVECSLGLFFQGRSDLLYLLPRGFGSPVPIGQPVRSTLAAFPNITGARLLAGDNVVAFVCTDAARTSGRVICYDVRNNQWTIDKVAGGVAHIGSAMWDGLLALTDGSAIDFESSSLGTDRGSFMGITLETMPLRPAGLQQDGRTRKIGVIGEYAASCQLKAELSTDDGQTYPYSRQWDLDQPSVPTAGDTVRREWELPVQKFGSCCIRLSEVVQLSGVGTRGLVLNGITLDTRARPGMPRVRESFR